MNDVTLLRRADSFQRVPACRLCPSRCTRRGHGARRSGFSLIETVVATVLVSITLVAALNTMAFVIAATNHTSDSQTASRIAQTLLSEIASHPFKDPINGTTAIGKEGDETSLPRAQWDDCDDYHSWSLSALTDLDGNALAGAAGWSAAVSVSYCSPTDPAIASGTATTLKKITLTLTSPAAQTFVFHSLRCDMGTLLTSQVAGSSVLSGVDVSLQAAGQSHAFGTRLHNQQEPN